MHIRIIITAGPTIEPIDPVRFLSNRSTGYMGYKLAEAASKRRHSVTLISGPTSLRPPKVKKFISIETASTLLKILKKELKSADCLIMCSAVSDFRVKKSFRQKIKRKKRLSLELVANKDILKEISSYKKGKLYVGFSLETSNLIKNARRKLNSKRLDLIVANQLKKGCNIFGDNKIDAYMIHKDGIATRINKKTKAFIAHLLLDKIEKLWYLKDKQ
ncbi:MAG: phosphopantothenoylcysteine decarboxylase [Candidatus Omnitrophica bacterium]|nr:phosphopantothenoylcysteine decarboxylase [Candidatus Omnitrophota bacterium]